MIKFDFAVILPEIFLLLTVVAVLLNDCFRTNRVKANHQSYWISVLGLLGAALLVLSAYGQYGMTQYWDMQVMRLRYIDLLKMSSLLLVAVGLIYSRARLLDSDLYRGEFFILVLLGALGMMVLISAASLLTIYLGLELMSLSMYALVAMNRRSTRSAEAAMKYFVMGAIASGLLLYGMALLYGATQSIYIVEIVTRLDNSLFVQQNRIILLAAMVFLIIGISFKFGLVPYHTWVPDVYEGSPLPVVAYVATAPKLAALAMAINLLSNISEVLIFDWQKMLVVLVSASFILGNLVALMQVNLKRMLAYSAIAHAGFILLGIAVSAIGMSIFYVITYAMTTLAALGLLMLLHKNGHEIEYIADLKGFNAKHPWFAFLFLCVFCSMAGLPVFVGFHAKLYILQAALAQGLITCVVIAVIFSAIGLFYYLRIIKVMYFDDPVTTELQMQTSPFNNAILSFNALSLLMLGIYPTALLAWCLNIV